MPDVPSRPGSSRGPWLLVLVLLLPAVVVPLLVPIYDREDPTLLGFPFYYWFQFALIPAAVVLTVSAYVLAKGVDRRARVEHGLPPVPDGTGESRTRRVEGDER